MVDVDSPLFKDVPGNNIALFGGNIPKLQDWLQSTFSSAVENAAASVIGRGFKTWMECFAGARDLRTAAGLALVDGQAEIRTAMTGIGLRDLVRCAKESGFEANLDGDGKYLVIETAVRNKVVSLSYLELRDHAVYSRQRFVLGASSPLVTRAELEADQVSAATSSAADDKDLLAIAREVDRTAMWVAGTGRRTPFADKVGEAYGTFDVSRGLRVVLVAEIPNETLREQLINAYYSAKKHDDKLTPEQRALLGGVELRDDGGRLHLVVDWSEDQVVALMKTLAKALVPHGNP